MRWKIWPSSKGIRKGLNQRWVPLFERTMKLVFAVLIGSTLIFFLSRSGILRQLESYALNTQMRLQAANPDSEVVVVLINDEDYRSLFQGKSPLNQAKLSQLISAIAAGKPRVIGVDIDTSDSEFQQLQPQPDWPPVVWARNGVFSNREGKLLLSPVLANPKPQVLSGVIVLQLESDGATRRYPRLCATDQGQVESFPWAVAKAYAPVEAAKRKPTNEGLLIQFAGDSEGSHRLHFQASRVLDLASGAGWQTNSPIKDKIVLLGGAYRATDEHDTPLGWMLGVEVLAYGIETELHGGGVTPPSAILVTVLGAIVGLALLLLFEHFKPLKAFLISLLALPVVGVLSSLLTFDSMAYWAYFMPIPLAVLVQEVFAQMKDYRKKTVKNLYKEVIKKPVSTIAPAVVTSGEMTTVEETASSPEPKPSAPPK